MSKCDLITISIPVYNVEDYVKRALLSALNQVYENIEYIIIDDKGSDNSMSIVRDVISEHPRGKYVKIIDHEFNRGTGATKNTAISNANGRYIYFMDSDDEITQDCIQKLYDEIIRSNVDIVGASYSEVKLSGMVECKYTKRVESCQQQILLSYFDGTFPVYTWNKLYRLDFLKSKEIKCVAHQTIEDNYFTFQVLLHAGSYSMLPDITYFYYLRATSSTNGNIWTEKIYKQWCEIFVDQLNLIKNISLSPFLKQKVLEKLFWQRVSVAKMVLKSQYDSRMYVNTYLGIQLEKTYRFSSFVLALAYVLSLLPFGYKKFFLKLHFLIYNL